MSHVNPQGGGNTTTSTNNKASSSTSWFSFLLFSSILVALAAILYGNWQSILDSTSKWLKHNNIPSGIITSVRKEVLLPELQTPEANHLFTQHLHNASTLPTSLVICIDDTVAEDVLRSMKHDASLLAKDASRVGVCTLTLEQVPVLGEAGAAVAEISRIKPYVLRSPERIFTTCFQKAANVFQPLQQTFKSVVVFTAGVASDVSSSVQSAKFLRETGVRITFLVYGEKTEASALTPYSSNVERALHVDIVKFHKAVLGKTEYRATAKIDLKAPGNVRNDMVIDFTITNNKMGADIPAGTRFIVRESNYSLASEIFFGKHKQHYQPFEHVFDAPLSAGSQVSIEAVLKTENDAIALSLPSQLVYEFVDDSNVVLLSNTIAMSTDYFLREIVQKLNQVGEWKVLYVGEFGAGKSTVINNVVSILKQQVDKDQHFTACPSEGHCTLRTDAVTAGRLTQIDTIGFANDTYYDNSALTYLLKDWVPRGFVGTNVSSIVANNSITPVKVAILVFSVKRRSESTTSHSLSQIKSAAEHMKRIGFTPIYIISHLNGVAKGERAKAFKEACGKIGVNPNQAIPFMQNSDELLRNFDEDLFAYSVLQRIIQRAEQSK